MKYLGIDYGEKRIGVATASDEEGRASGLRTLIGAPDPGAAVVTLAEEEAADVIVVGLPRGLDGQETRQTEKVRAFAERLETESGKRVELVDEAVTSVVARERLEAAGVKIQPGDIDREAAAIILQDYLDAR